MSLGNIYRTPVYRARSRQCVTNLHHPRRLLPTVEQMPTARSIREHELDELLTLYQMLNPDDPELQGGEELYDQWEEMLYDDSVEVVVVKHDDRLVASCILAVIPNLTRNARPFGVIENVITHEEYRQQGFGKLCLQAATGMAEERDCYKIMLLTGSDKEWKHAFYESCGFNKEAKTGFVREL